MAFENLLIRTNRSIGGITMDAVISETITNTLRITKNPVELGADITDHAIIEPKQYTLDAVITDSPLLGVNSIDNVGQSISSSGFFGSSSEDSRTRSQAAFDALVALQESRQPIEVQTGLTFYRDMLISDITITQDKDSSRAIFFNAKLTQVILTSTEEINFPQDQLEAPVTQQQGSSPIDEGQKQPLPIESDSSILFNLFGG